MIKHLILDLDNTLYSARYGLEKEVSRRIEVFLSGTLGLSRDESEDTHRSLIREQGYGTTIEWLMAEKGFTDIDGYYAAIYPENEGEVLQSDPSLREFLESIPLPKAILTNAPQIHADNILDRLGIKDVFQYIFDIRLNNYRGKPHREAFSLALQKMGAQPGSTLFVDDYPEFVAGFVKFGGKAVLMDEFGRFSDLPFSRIKSIYEITAFL